MVLLREGMETGTRLVEIFGIYTNAAINGLAVLAHNFIGLPIYNGSSLVMNA